MPAAPLFGGLSSVLVRSGFATRSIPPSLLFWLIAGALAGVYLFYRGFCLLQRKRLIQNTPSSKVRSAAMGLVEISGLATGPYTLIAPITGKACYYYRTMVWRWKQQGKNSSWVKEADESLHLPFFLEDNTGRLLVNPQGAELDIHRDFQEEFSHSLFSSSLEVPANIANFLVTHGIDTDAKIKVEEYCIKPKNALFVLGTLAQNHGLAVNATPVRTVATEQKALSLNFWVGLNSTMSFTKDSSFSMQKAGEGPRQSPQSENHAPLDPARQAELGAVLAKAGITNPGAWAAAGIDRPIPANSGGGTAAAAVPAPETFDLHPPTVLMKGTHDPAFFISWRSQREVVKALGWKAALMIWGGPPLTLICVYLLAARLGW
jgi:hypothetical protein